MTNTTEILYLLEVDYFLNSAPITILYDLTPHDIYIFIIFELLHSEYRSYVLSYGLGQRQPLWHDNTLWIIVPCETSGLHKEPVMWSFEILFVINLNELLDKQSSCWWFETPWHPCDIAVMMRQQRPIRRPQYLLYLGHMAVAWCQVDSRVQEVVSVCFTKLSIFAKELE